MDLHGSRWEQVRACPAAADGTTDAGPALIDGREKEGGSMARKTVDYCVWSTTDFDDHNIGKVYTAVDDYMRGRFGRRMGWV